MDKAKVSTPYLDGANNHTINTLQESSDAKIGGRIYLLFLRGALAALITGFPEEGKVVKTMPPQIVGLDEPERMAFRDGFASMSSSQVTQEQLHALCLRQKNVTANRNTIKFIRFLASISKVDGALNEQIRRLEKLIETNLLEGELTARDRSGTPTKADEPSPGITSGIPAEKPRQGTPPRRIDEALPPLEPPVPVIFMPCLSGKRNATIIPIGRKDRIKWKWDGRNLYSVSEQGRAAESWIWNGRNLYRVRGSNECVTRWSWDGRNLYPATSDAAALSTWKWDGRNLCGPRDRVGKRHRWTWDGKSIFPEEPGMRSLYRWIIQ